MGKVFRFIKEFIIILACAFVIAMLLRYFVVTACNVLSPSMVPTLQTGDRLLASRLAYTFDEPARGDIIIFTPPDEYDEGIDYIKRVIALPGETVAVRNGYVYIDGEALAEPYIAERPLDDFGPVTVPPNEYFVLGDNRNHSADSRYWHYHFVPAEDINGQAFFRFFPFNRLGRLTYEETFFETDPALSTP